LKDTAVAVFCSDSMVVNPNATVYIVTGAAGSREGHEPFRLPKPVYSAVRFDTYGYSKMMPVNSTHLYWKQIQTDSGEPNKDMGETIDEMWLIVDKHGPFPDRVG
jgi:hypothetical protein